METPRQSSGRSGTDLVREPEGFGRVCVQGVHESLVPSCGKVLLPYIVPVTHSTIVPQRLRVHEVGATPQLSRSSPWKSHGLGPMKLSESTKQWLMVTAVLCAVILTGLRVSEFVAERTNAVPTHSTSPIVVAGWERYATVGHRLGPIDAPATIVVFADFECPYCAVLATSALPKLRARYPTQVVVVYRHFPLRGHRFAYPAARAEECAARQNRFDAYHDQLFARQDSLGLLTFMEIARAAGVPDLGAFAKCDSTSGAVESIELDLRAAKELGAHVTPTVLMGGRMYSGAPSLPILDSLVADVLRKKHPDP